MAEALKHFFNAELIRSLADELGRVHSPLDRRRFMQDGLAGLEALELTARGAHLAQVMRSHLPQDYETAVGVIVKSLGPEHGQSETFGMAPSTCADVGGRGRPRRLVLPGGSGSLDMPCARS